MTFPPPLSCSMSMFLVHLPSNPTLPTSDTLITVCVPRPPHFHIVHCLVYPATPSQMSPHQHHIDHLIVVVHEWLILQVQLDYIIIFFLLWLKNTVWVQIWKVPEPHLNHTRPQCGSWFGLRAQTTPGPGSGFGGKCPQTRPHQTMATLLRLLSTKKLLRTSVIVTHIRTPTPELCYPSPAPIPVPPLVLLSPPP